jgi:hypothetical protein
MSVRDVFMTRSMEESHSSDLVCSADMIIDNDPPITKSISIPKEMSQLSCSAFSAGIVEAVLDGLAFVRSLSLM